MVAAIVTPAPAYCRISVKKFWGARKATLSTDGTLTLNGVTIKGNREEWVSGEHLTDPTRLQTSIAEQARAGCELGGQAHGTLGAANEILVRENLINHGLNPSQILNPSYLNQPGGQVEISDGVILYGTHAFMVQIKSTMDTTKHISWFRQKIRDHRHNARKQAKRSMEWLKTQPVTIFTDHNNNLVTVDPSEYTWSNLLISKFDQLPVADPSRYMLNTDAENETTINSKEVGDLLDQFTPEETLNFLRRSTNEQTNLFGFALINAFQYHLAGLYTGDINNPGLLTRIDDVLNDYPVNEISKLRTMVDRVEVKTLQNVSKHYWNAVKTGETVIIPLTKRINLIVNSTDDRVAKMVDKTINIHLSSISEN